MNLVPPSHRLICIAVQHTHLPHFSKHHPGFGIGHEIGDRWSQENTGKDLTDQTGHFEEPLGNLASCVDGHQKDHALVQRIVVNVYACTPFTSAQ